MRGHFLNKKEVPISHEFAELFGSNAGLCAKFLAGMH